MSTSAACNGLPISGRKVSCASATPATPSVATISAAAAAFATPRLLDELFIPDHSELGNTQALRRREDECHVLVFDELVRPDVHLGLVGLGRSLQQARLERSAVGHRLALPGNGAGGVDVARDH